MTEHNSYGFKYFFIGFLIHLIYIFQNYFVAYIPSWIIRKFFYRLLGMKIGKGTRINQRCIIMAPWKINIGNNNIINEYTLLDGRGGLDIGNNNSISMYTKIYTGSHKSYSNTFEYFDKKTEIKDNCWLGTASVIMPGSIINDFSIISVNSVYKGATQQKGIYMGNPAIFVRERKIDTKYQLKWHTWFI